MKNATTQMPYLKRAATEKPFLWCNCGCLEATAAILLEGEAAPEAGIGTRVTRQWKFTPRLQRKGQCVTGLE